jgi:hypothetical protein
MRKPTDMGVREFYNHLVRINYTELTKLPPFNANQQLGDNEVVDVLLYAFPKSWQGEMERQGFDPLLNTPHELMKFCERLECAEAIEGKFNKVEKKNSNKKNGNKKSKNDSSSDEKYCHFHGKGNHSSNDCKTLKAMAESAKKNSSNKFRSNKNGNSKNKTWSKKAEDAKENTKKDLAAFIKKQIQAELNAVEDDSSNKRKADSDAESSDDEINMIDAANFDFSNLDLGDEDDKSVKTEASA